MNRPDFCVTEVTKGTRERLLTPSVTAPVRDAIQMNKPSQTQELNQESVAMVL